MSSQLTPKSIALGETTLIQPPRIGEATEGASVTPEGKALVSSDDYALIVAEKAARLVEERRRTSTRVLVGGLVTIVGIVSYLGISNLRGIVIDEVGAQSRVVKQEMTASVEEMRARQVRQAEDMQKQVALIESGIKLSNREEIMRLETGLTARLDAFDDSWRRVLLEEAHNSTKAAIDIALQPIERSSDEMLGRLASQGQQITLMALNGVIETLKDGWTEEEQGQCVDAVVSLASTPGIVSNEKFMMAASDVLQNLSGASQNHEVDAVEAALWPVVEEQSKGPRSASMVLLAKILADHYGLLAIAESIDSGPVVDKFNRYSNICLRMGFPEYALHLELGIMFGRSKTKNDGVLLVWDAVLDMSKAERRQFFVSLVEKTDELMWRKQRTAHGKRLERKFRELWIAFEKELLELGRESDTREEIEKTIASGEVDELFPAAYERVLNGKRPWQE